MERLESKKVNGRTYYYYSEWGWKDGKCRRIWQKYLGKPKDIVQAVQGGGPPPLYAEVFQWGLPCALWKEVLRARVVEETDALCPKREQGLSTGQYMAVAAVNRAIRPKSKRSMWEWFSRTALLPALISYLALFYVVHMEALKLNLKAIPRKDLPLFFRTFIRGCYFLIPLGVLIIYLVVLRRSPITAALLAVESLIVIMLIQRPVMVFLKVGTERRNGTLDPSVDFKASVWAAFLEGLGDIWNGLIGGARNMVAVGVATATAGIIVGVVTITGMVGRFIILIDTISMGNVVLMLIFTAMTCLILGMGMPTTANYIIMATLTAPVIVKLGGDAGLVFPLIAAHLFVFYFGILADDTPPVGLAAYAGAAIARSDPIRTGIQGFTYDLRTAILPFIFLFNNELLMISGLTDTGRVIWLNDPLLIGWVFFSGLIAMFAFASMLQGQLVERCNLLERLVLLAIAASTFRAATIEAYIPLLGPRTIQVIGVCTYFGMIAYQKLRRRPFMNHMPGKQL
ncbi:MAG: TRAP transporter large permease subunit [Thermodesulfobacteriota bacterium]